MTNGLTEEMLNGPAAALYRALVPGVPMRDRWVAEIRELWGKKDHPSLDDFPKVERTERTFPSLDAGFDVPVTIFTPSDASGAAFVYLHGGGWIAPASGKHLGWAKRMAALSGQTVIAVHYRLAPEQRYPCALHDCVGVFQAIKDIFSGQITVGGDSAGANLAAALWFFCRDKGWFLPEKLMLNCGVLDLQLEKFLSMQVSGKDHPYNGLELLAFQRALYAPSHELWTDPYASPAHGDLSSLPSTLVIVGGEDTLRDDGVQFAERAKMLGVAVQLHIGEKMPHGFHMQHALVPAAAAAAEKVILEFLATE
ncbi:MAG: alpha/beta hydrolase [Akkermansiaceae bacterium]|nr:alpha/beta hydrolase [Akkermansiaceae bacterium]